MLKYSTILFYSTNFHGIKEISPHKSIMCDLSFVLRLVIVVWGNMRYILFFYSNLVEYFNEFRPSQKPKQLQQS